jgi:hypothetical protein
VSASRTVAIMQPYFFPYAGYFSLIKHTDRFILFDPVQFIRHGWIDRNRVLKQGDGWIYIRPPLIPYASDALISTVRVDNAQPWRDKLLAQIVPYKRVAPFYWPVRKLVIQAIAGEHETIAALNKATLEAVCGYLGFPRELEIFSEMNLPIDPPTAPDEWALNICRALGDVGTYWNPPGGQDFFDRGKYDAAGIDLRFHTLETPVYDQRRAEFTPHLSIIDTLMFNTPDEVNAMLDRYTLS